MVARSNERRNEKVRKQFKESMRTGESVCQMTKSIEERNVGCEAKTGVVFV